MSRRTALTVARQQPQVAVSLGRTARRARRWLAALDGVASGERYLPPLPPKLGESVRRRLDDEEQAVFGLLFAGVEPPDVAATLGLSGAELESRLWEMLRRLEAPPGTPAR